MAPGVVLEHDGGGSGRSRSDSPERPLVLTGQRLYLRRYWNYERSIAQGR